MAVRSAQPCAAPRAARTASRTSFRDPRTAFARGEPSAAPTRYERPDSDRGNCPPMYSLYVLRTPTRAGAATTFVALGTTVRLVPLALARATSAVLELHVGVQPVHAALAPESRLLVPAERRGRIEAVERVGPHDAGLHLPDHPQDPAALLGPHAGRESIRGVVGLLDGLVGGAERQHRQHGPEDLLPGDAVALGDVREE